MTTNYANFFYDLDHDYIQKKLADYKLTGIPFTVVITPNGKIAAIHMGFDEKSTENLKKDVEAALATKG